jgi:hypothetical protein
LRHFLTKIGGGHLKNSRFWETAAEDWVRSALLDEAVAQEAVRFNIEFTIVELGPAKTSFRRRWTSQCITDGSV